MSGNSTNQAATLALQALAATIGDQRLAERFLSLSGLSPPDLRQRAADPAVLAALLRFLESHEPDLVSVAEEIGTSPEALVAARRTLEA
jgi:hypothetical protein